MNCQRKKPEQGSATPSIPGVLRSSRAARSISSTTFELSSNSNSSLSSHVGRTPSPPIPPKPGGLSEYTRSSASEHSAAGSLAESPVGSLRRSSVDFSKIRPPVKRAGERTVSTALRLRRQGFRASENSPDNFAVKSLRRGTEEWNSLIKPFVSDLVFKNVSYLRYQSDVSFHPYSCQAAVLFVDLSNYSKISAALSNRGAHALSAIVNGYLGKLLSIIHSYAGDVVKFAGDAVLVVWEGEGKDLETNVLCAARCATELQERAGCYIVEGTKFSFQIHCGLACGTLESEIFAAAPTINMQRLYHIVTGESLIVVSELVDLAKAGETCVSETCLQYLGNRAKCKDVEGYGGCKLLTGVNFDYSVLKAIDEHVDATLSSRLMRRNQKIEEDFIHPCVIRFLSHGGLSPMQIAQMRSLCVLFIAMTSNGSSVNWLMEVQSILDKNRCPIVQIIDDDKGIHVVAAINLYESFPETSIMGLEVCHDLIAKQVGCAIGMAQGSTFCGVTGCSTVACRWDITGPPAVRAARLMQYALKEQIEVAIDQSVYNDPIAATRMTVLDNRVFLKGTTGSVPVYTICATSQCAAFRVLETVHGRVHDPKVEQITEHIQGNGSRCAVLVTGIPLAGKKIICQRAAGYANLVPFLHVSDKSAGFLQLARTIATWFRYVDNDDVRYLATSVLEHMSMNRWCRAHDECIDLVNLALAEGFRSCFLVDRVQFLDDFSVSLLRECLHGVSHRNRRSSSSLQDSLHELSERSELSRSDDPGMICFLCVHVSLYNWKSACHIVQDITRSHKSLRVPIVEVGEATRDELRTLFVDLADVNVDDRWLDAYAEASGFCAGYFIERAAAINKLSISEKQTYSQTTKQLALTIPPGKILMNKKVKVRNISGEVCMRFQQLFDELPPLFQTFAKVLTIATRGGYYKLPRVVMWEVLNDLIADGVETGVYNIVLDEFKDMDLVKIDVEDDEDVLSFQSPALADIGFDVSTPLQIESIGHALIERLEPRMQTSFKIPFVVASLHILLNEEEEMTIQLWREGYEMFLETSQDWESEIEVNKWVEAISDDIEDAGFTPTDILGEDFHVPYVPLEVVGEHLPMLKLYSAPIALGPMGHSLSVLTRNTVHEFSVFNGLETEAAAKLRSATTSAAYRYLHEMDTLEEYLADNGVAAPKDELLKEREMILELAQPAPDDEAVQTKATVMLVDYIPTFVEARLHRLYTLVDRLRQAGVPDVVQTAEPALRRAYEALRAPSRRTDAAQDALMILASSNFKPRPVPEFLPILYYQTVARIRNRALKHLTDAELIISKHQQNECDLECFLLVTALLYHEQDKK